MRGVNFDLDSIHEDLSRVEPRARELDPVPAAFAKEMVELTAFSQKFLEEIPNERAWLGPMRSPAALREPIPQSPAPFSELLDQYRRQVLTSGIHTTSGRFLGYVPGGGLPAAAMGDYLAALTNKYSGVYSAAPGAAEIENTAIRWLREIVGYPEEAWGTLQSGGSLATLTAVVCARETRRAEDWHKSVAYFTSEAHLTIAKSLHIAGLGQMARREVATDEEFRLSLPDLRRKIREDRSQGLKPWIIFASAGTTNTGAIDPLGELAELARSEDLWLHIDAAYGGFFVLCEQTHEALSAMARADSIVLDPHKGLFLPYGCGAVLTRNGAHLRNSLSFHSDYLPPQEPGEERSPADYSPELTRHFRGLRLWFSLKAHGLPRFRAALEEKLLLARLAHAELRKMAGVETGPTPQLSCAVFRMEGDEARTEGLKNALLTRGRAFLSPTRLKGKLYLRLCVLCFRSHRAELEETLVEIRNALKI